MAITHSLFLEKAVSRRVWDKAAHFFSHSNEHGRPSAGIDRESEGNDPVVLVSDVLGKAA
jgi:hypothetical protein